MKYIMKLQIKLWYCEIIPNRTRSWLYLYDSKLTVFFFLSFYCRVYFFKLTLPFFGHIFGIAEAKPRSKKYKYTSENGRIQSKNMIFLTCSHFYIWHQGLLLDLQLVEYKLCLDRIFLQDTIRSRGVV